jgi:hypothetical protein
MKRLAAVITMVLAAVTLTACTPTPDPADSVPSGRMNGSFWGWIEDINGDEIIHDIAITVDGFALDAIGGQEDSSWNLDWTLTGFTSPLPLDMVKRSPYSQPVYWRPGQTVSLSVTIIFEDAQFGDKVQCWQDDSEGVMMHETQRTTIKETRGRGTISVNCNFIFI